MISYVFSHKGFARQSGLHTQNPASNKTTCTLRNALGLKQLLYSLLIFLCLLVSLFLSIYAFSLLVLLFPTYTSYLVLFLFPLVHIRVFSKVYRRKLRSGVLPLLYRIQEVLGSDIGSEIDYALSLRTIAVAGLSNRKCPAIVLHCAPLCSTMLHCAPLCSTSFPI